MNRIIINTETETIIKILSTNKSSGPEGFTGEFYPKLRENLTPIVLKLFQKIAEERKFPNPFYEVTPIPNQTKMPQKKKITGQYH